LLQNCVADGSWRPVDGRDGGEITRWGGVLVIKQTAAHHREIARVGGILLINQTPQRHRDIARLLAKLKAAVPQGAAPRAGSY
jgi:hypothetical protein